VLFYLIVLYGCVCQPLINGYDDDDDDNFSSVKVRMTTNDARCSVVVEHLAPGQTSTTGVEVGVPLSLGYDERGRVV